MSAAAAAPMNKIERAHKMYREGRYEEALSFYTQALGMARAKPQKIALHSNRAACFLKLHDFKKAAEECTSVLELDRDHTGALMLRAQTLVTLKEYSSSLFDVNRLMELNPSSEVYQNLHDRLKTQLSLAPIPEAEEEFEEEEEEGEDECKDEADLKGDDAGKEELVQEIEDDVHFNEQKSDFHQRVNAKVIPDTKILKGDAEVKEGKDLCPSKKIELQSKTLKTEAATNQTKITKASSAEQNSMGWKAIPKPKGHSRLDYSRWDKVVEDGSSDDEDDSDDDEYRPQYRFRVKTVGVRSVK